MRARWTITAAVLLHMGAHPLDAQSNAQRVDAIFSFAGDSTPGCAVGAMRDGALLYANGYGMADLENNVRITPRTAFYMASTSKQFTAGAINLLVLDGKLSLDDDVRKYIPELPQFGSTITLRHLLNHTSGLRDYLALFSLAGFTDYAITNADFLAMLGRQRALNFAPGTQYSYSNTGYVLLSIVVQRVSGKSLREFAQERIFTPLAMESTRFRDDHRMLIPHRAAAYAGRPGAYRLSVPYFDVVGDGGLFSTVEDVARWESNFWNPRVGGTRWVAAMAERGHLNDRTALTYGAGLAYATYRGDSIVEHSGGLGGYNAELLRIPRRRFSVTVLCNSFAVSADVLARRVVDVFLGDSLGASPPVTTPPRQVASLGTAAPERYPGVFFSPTTQLVRTISLVGGKLFYVRGPTDQAELLPESDGQFVIAGTPVRISFTPAADTLRIESATPVNVLIRKAPPLRDVKAYAGRYTSDELRVTWQVVAGDSTMTLHEERGDTTKLIPVFADAFTGGGLLLQFIRDRAGNVEALDVSAGDRSRSIRFDRAR